MELDLTAIVDQTAEKMWNARLMFTGADPWAETDLNIKNVFKEQILGPIFHSSEFVVDAVKQQLIRQINASHDNGDSAGETILILLAELSN